MTRWKARVDKINKLDEVGKADRVDKVVKWWTRFF